MTKRFIYLAVGALALTACTSQEEVDNVLTSKSNVIKFENVVNKHSRADITTGDLSEFNVFGFYTLPGNENLAHKVFDNVAVEKTGENNWDYSAEAGERYWVPGAKYYFYAYSCQNLKIDETIYPTTYTLDVDGEKAASARVLTINDYVCNNAHQHDLIFASHTDIEAKESGNDNVSLEFSHILSKVKTKFTTKFPAEYTIVISDITIQGYKDKGSYTPGTGWTGLTQSEEGLYLALSGESNTLVVYNAKDGEGETQKQMSEETGYYYVIPAEEGEYALKFTIDVYLKSDTNLENKIMSKTLTGNFKPSWEPGFQYVYNVELNGSTTNMQVISFTTSVSDFKDAEGIIIDGGEGQIEFVVTDNGVGDNNSGE